VTRIVGGAMGGRRLAVPPGRGTRPTSDRAREAMFATLASMLDLEGARVLDLFAGSGAIGLEALSRGAAPALLVESDARAVATIRSNAAALGLGDRAVVVHDRAERVLAGAPAQPYHLVFLDPPYTLPDEAVEALLAALASGGWLAPEVVVVVERATRGGGPAWPASLRPAKQRSYGEGTLWYGRRP
jgi:16S rRNA (guanine966-N2)-methyltransferase